MNKFSFHIEVNGKPNLAKLRFAARTELQAYHRSLSSSSNAAPQIVKDAIEFTSVAAKDGVTILKRAKPLKVWPDCDGRWRKTNAARLHLF